MIAPKGLVPRDPQREETCLVFYCTTDVRQGEGAGIAWRSGSRLVGKQSTLRAGHAREPVARHEA